MKEANKFWGKKVVKKGCEEERRNIFDYYQKLKDLAL